MLLKRAVCAVLVALVWAGSAYAQTPTALDVATISMTNATTPKLVSNSACYTDGNDLACDRGVYLLPGGTVSATNISVTRISGDGSQLTNLPAAAASPTNVPAFRVMKNGSNQTITPVTATLLTWPAEQLDTYNNFSGNRFTPTVPGVYLFDLSIMCDLPSFAEAACVAYVFKNGSPVSAGNSRGSAYNYSAHTSVVLSMNGSTDYVEAFALNESNPAVISGDGSYTSFQGSLLASGNGLISGSTALSDRITSGTVAALVNSTGYISLSTASSTWGYFGSADSYLPRLTTAQVSATTISTTAVQIFSPTTALACSSSTAGTIRYNSPTTTLELCTGSGWQPMGVGVPAGTISAFASTTCPTGWSEYTAARGRFLRGIDNGAGNDPDGTRAPGSTQADLLGSHTHLEAGITAAAGGGTQSNVQGGSQWYAVRGSDPNALLTAASGGMETRPKNVAVIYCQFNGTSNGWNNPLSGGGTVPGGSTGAVQYNTSGSFDGSTNFTWSNASSTLGVTGLTSTTSITVGGRTLEQYIASSSTATGDRITSGTTSVVANSATNTISFSVAGVNTGYMNGLGQLSVPGIGIGRAPSATLPFIISATGWMVKLGLGDAVPNALMLSNNQIATVNQPLYINYSYSSDTLINALGGNVGVRTQNPSTSLHVSGTLRIADGGEACDANRAGAIRYTSASIFQTCNGGGTWSAIGSGGIASPTNVPAFSVNRSGSGNQTVAADTPTKLVLQTIEFDTYNNYDSANSRFRPTVAGVYLFKVNLYCPDSTSWCQARIYKNGADVVESGTYGGAGLPNASRILYMNGTTDYVEAWVYNGGGTTVGGSPAHTFFSGSLLASGNGLISGTSGSGVSRLASLTDVSVANLVSGNVLVYNAATTSWTNLPIQQVMSTTTMEAGWPDAIVCNDTGNGIRSLRLDFQYFTTGTNMAYYRYTDSTNSYVLRYTSTGAFSGTQETAVGSGYDCVGSSLSIAQLYARGQAFNFVGTGPSAADRIMSGTTQVAVNTSTSTISFTVGGVNTGYINSSGLLVLPGISATTNNSSFTSGYFSGNVGVGTNTASTTLHVSGTLRIGDSGAACDANRAGAIRYTSASTFQTCNGSAWSAIGSGGSASPTDVPAFSVHRNSVNQTVTGNVNTAIDWTTKTYDNTNSFNLTNDRYTPPVAGRYLFTGSLYCATVTNYCQIFLNKNGSSVATNFNPASDSLVNVSTILDMNGTTDYVTLSGMSANGTTFMGGSAGTYFQGSLVASGNGLISGTTGSGVSAIASLTDVSLSNLTGGQMLRFNGTSWTNVNIQDTISTTTMAAGWPDAISCDDNTPPFRWNAYASLMPGSDGKYYYRPLRNTGGDTYFTYNADGTFNSGLSLNTSAFNCHSNGWSIAQLYAQGRAFNFIGGSGTVTPTVDRITSGTTGVVANSATSAISFTVGGVNTGYMNSSGLLVLPGISLTTAHGISSSNGYYSGLLNVDRSGYALRNVGGAFSAFTGAGEAAYSQIAYFAARHTATTESRLMIGQVTSNTMFIETADISNTKGITVLQPYGGKVGVGKSIPTTVLDLSGTLRVGDGGEACDASRAGAIRYTSASIFQTCNGGGTWSAIGSGSGASRLTSLTDVSLSNVTSGQMLRYNGTTWTNVNIQDTISTTTMVAGWPDAIACYWSGGPATITMLRQTVNHSTGVQTYVYPDPTTSYSLSYTSSGAYSGNNNLSSYDCASSALSIGQLYSMGRAYNFIGGSGTVTPTVDNITSGTTSVVANTANSISFTLGGTTTGYFNSTGRLVVPGISATTNASSFTTGYFSGNVGIGNAAPSTPLDVSGTIRSTATGFAGLVMANPLSSKVYSIYGGSTGYLTIGDETSSTARINIAPGGNVGIGMVGQMALDVAGAIRGQGVSGAGDVLVIGNDSKLVDINVANMAGLQGVTNAAVGGLTLGSGGGYVWGASNSVGINTQAPAARLDVNGELRVGTNSLTCSASTLGAIRFTGGDFSFCRNGSSWESMSTLTSTPDRIVSGTTSVIANTAGTIDFTVSGTIYGKVDSSGNIITSGSNVYAGGNYGYGYAAMMHSGNVTNAGYTGYYAPGGLRTGYLGYSDASWVYLSTENGRGVYLRPDNGLVRVSGTMVVAEGASTVATERNGGYQLWGDSGFGMELHYGQTGQSTGWATALYGRKNEVNALRFGAYTANATSQTQFSEYMTLNNNGYLGIGSTAPAAPLEISSSATANGMVRMNAPAGSYRHTRYLSGNVVRWDVGVDSTAEGGSNAGSHFFINRFSDAGAYLDTPLAIYRNTGNLFMKGIGVGVLNPSTTLHTNGAIRMGSAGEACDADRTGAVRYTGGDFSFCRDGATWETLTSLASTSDRIVSGTTNAIAYTAGRMVFTASGVEEMRITTAGVSATGLYVAGDISYTGVLTDVSDRRLKDKIAKLPYTHMLERFMLLQPVQFEMKERPGLTEYGFIAQELQKVFPDLVFTGTDRQKTLSVNLIGLIAPTVQVVQELKRENDALKAKVDTLELRLQRLEKLLDAGGRQAH